MQGKSISSNKNNCHILAMFLEFGALIFAGLYFLYKKWHDYVQHTEGSLPIKSADCLYKTEKNENILRYDKHCFYLHGKPVIIISAEFHYWRAPDSSQWEMLLRLYKSLGLNAVRIYFHWRYHSPSEGVYYFDGNRDIDHLLTLCEKIGLYVLAAPGPYICGEASGGGYPFWLLQKNHIRIRHNVCTAMRQFDERFSEYCKQWFDHIMPILAAHQVSSSKMGCVIAVQIENENFENLPSNGPLSFLAIIHKLLPGFRFPLGLHDDMRHLAFTARQNGITVPLFTNDAWEAGSFIAKKPYKSSTVFGLDLYGFDKYVVFAPASEVGPAMVFRGKAGHRRRSDNSIELQEWNPSDFRRRCDRIEETIRGFGHAAAEASLIMLHSTFYTEELG
jgi:hypothetical protein